ncbi:MAG: nitroreductase family protein [Caldiserica bacterium]|jgi:nitroreductase|nr:nitroreductase family protein [Caldisericota bacterium]MDH7562432.1 nitroreductase family protein [Caldisericota bacterium]
MVSKGAFEVILNRRSIRSFKGDPVPDEFLQKILIAAQMAPSAGNRQPWHFFVVRNQELKDRLAVAAFGQDFLSQAPIVIVVCADPERSESRYGERGRSLYSIQDTASAVMNMWITAVELGLASCWVGAFDEAKVRDSLSLPSQLRPVAMLPIGFPGERGVKTPRRPLEEIVTFLD